MHLSAKIHCPPRIHSQSRYGTSVQHQAHVTVAIDSQHCRVRSVVHQRVADLIGRLPQRTVTQPRLCKRILEKNMKREHLV